MKKILVILLALMFIGLSGCKKKIGDIAPISGVVNPVQEVETLDQLNYVCGTNLLRPAVMGLTDESYSYINNNGVYLAQYGFSVNGMEYLLRTSFAYEDISGLYIDGKLAFEDNSENYVETKEFKAYQWFNGNEQYVLTVYDNGKMNEEQFLLIASEIENLSQAFFSESKYDKLSGSFIDENTMSIKMETYSMNDYLGVDIYYPISANELYHYILTLTYNNEENLEYNDMVKYLTTYDENGEVITEEKIDVDNNGYFNYQENKFIWNSNEEMTNGIVFVY